MCAAWAVDWAQKPELVVETGHSDFIRSVAFSPDGKTLASGSNDRTIKLWDVESAKELRTLVGHSDEVRSVVFSPDGNTLASGSEDGTIKLWKVESGKEIRTLAGHSSSVRSVAFAPDGKTVASGSFDKTIKLWAVATGKVLATFFAGQFSEIKEIAFSPDGKTIASVGDKAVQLWDIEKRQLLRTFAGPSYVESIAFSPDGKTIASGAADNTVKLWDVQGGGELRTITTQTHLPKVGFSPLVRSVAFSRDGKVLATAGDLSVKLWDVQGGNEMRVLTGYSDSPDTVAFSPDGTILASASYGKIRLWDVHSGKEIRTLSGQGNWVLAVAFSPDGKTVANSMDETITLWDIQNGTERTLTGKLLEVSALGFSPDGKTLASGSQIGKIKLWDVESGREIRSLTKRSDRFYLSYCWLVMFSANGKMLASEGGDDQITLWDVASGRELKTLDGKSAAVKQEMTRLFPRLYEQYNKAAVSDRYVAEVTERVKIKFFDRKPHRELATLIIYFGNDWVVTTPDGLFDGSPAAWNKLLWRFNNNTFDHAPVEAFLNEFYYPGLLSDIFAGKQPKAPSDISQKDRRQPEMKLALADKELNQPVKDGARKTTVSIEVSEPAADKDHKAGTGAQDVRLFRNGSLVRVWPGDLFALTEKDGCKLQPQATPQSPRHSVCTTIVPIVAGLNNFTAYAFNHDNIKSEDATLTVTGADSLKRKGTLHILAVGVSQYANKAYNLNYTTDDAASLTSQLKLQQEKLGRFETVNVKTLLNEEATKANILAELKRLSTVVQPEDAVVVYFSGHGKADGDHFYLVPHDLGYSGHRDGLLEGSPQMMQVLSHSISDLELEEAFRDIDAGQMFMIIDACNSGQALENKDEPRRGPMNTKGLAQLAYEKGMYILTASQNVEEAFVSEKLKHSYLTYALVEEGLKTKAADADQNGEVTLKEWFEYAVARVPKLREESLQSKSLVQVNPTVKAARNQKSQTPRVFYRREIDDQSLVVAKMH